MPNPSSANARQVNFELGVANTTEIKLSNNWVQNVASVAETEISTNTYDSGSGSVTAPSGAQIAEIYVWGGGGGSSTFGPAGGGGGFVFKRVLVTGGSTSISYSVGAAGAAGTAGGTSTATVSSTTYTATGGGGGSVGGAGAGGTGSGGDINDSGINGGTGFLPSLGGTAGGALYGGGSGGLGIAGSAPGGGGGTDVLNNAYSGAAGRVKIVWKAEPATSYGRLRWGINFPGRSVSPVNDYPNYANSNEITMSSSYLGSDSQDNEAFAECDIIFYSNGVLRYFAQAGSDSSIAEQRNYHKIWLTSGVNTDYTVRVTVDSGALNSGSDQIDTDLGLNTDRFFFVYAYVPGVGQDEENASGNIIIKTGTTEIFRRPYIISSAADIQSGV